MVAKLKNTNGFKKGHRPHNYNKRGEIQYATLHQWVKYHKPKSLFCEICGLISNKLDASSINHTYKRDISQWRWLCRKCHFKEDKKLKKLKEYCIRNHKLIQDNIIIDSRGNRVCKQCKKIRAHNSYLKNKDKIILRVNKYRQTKRSTIRR